jgi:hypothetical protein
MLTRRRFKNAAKRVLFSVHRAGLRAGVVILPNHYYVGIPDVNVLRRTTDIWARRSKLLASRRIWMGKRRAFAKCAPRSKPSTAATPFTTTLSRARQWPGLRLHRGASLARRHQAKVPRSA